MFARLRQAVFAVVLLCPLISFSDSEICRRKYIDGVQEYGVIAHAFLPPNTSEPSEAVIYITKTQKGTYFHSNYVTPGAENPTKIWTSEDVDLETIFANILFSNPKGMDITPAQQAIEHNALRHAHLILDTSMFDEEGYPRLDIGDATNIAVVDGSNRKMLIGPVDRLDRADPPPVLMSRVVGCCLFGIPPHLAAGYQRALEARPLTKDNIRFLSLVRDSGTETAIKTSKILDAARLGTSGTPINSLAQIESAFSSAQGKTVVLMSHVEGENFVTRDPGRRIVSSISVQSVRALATKYNVELIDLGCETAQHLRAERLGIGVTTTFNTVDAVRALDKAISASSNYSEFFQALTSENLTIVVDHGFMQKWPLCADVYGKAARGSILVKLARIFVNFSTDMDMSKFETPRPTPHGAETASIDDLLKDYERRMKALDDPDYGRVKNNVRKQHESTVDLNHP